MKMIKKIVFVVAFAIMLPYTANAQVFKLTDEDNSREEQEEIGYIPQQWVTYDQTNAYTPVGNGLLLLVAMCGGYVGFKKCKSSIKNY